jgi:peroxiredoxin
MAVLVLAFSLSSVSGADGAGQLKVGEKAADFELKTLDGKSVKLSEALEAGPAVVVVLRGFPGYQCPLCTRQVRSLTQSAEAFAAKNAKVILIYPGPSRQLNQRAGEFLKGSTLPDGFVLVTDPNYVFTNSYGLRWDAANETAYPSTFVVGQDQRVTFAVVSKSHGGRADTAKVIAAIP